MIAQIRSLPFGRDRGNAWSVALNQDYERFVGAAVEEMVSVIIALDAMSLAGARNALWAFMPRYLRRAYQFNVIPQMSVMTFAAELTAIYANLDRTSQDSIDRAICAIQFSGRRTVIGYALSPLSSAMAAMITTSFLPSEHEGGEGLKDWTAFQISAEALEQDPWTFRKSTWSYAAPVPQGATVEDSELFREYALAHTAARSTQREVLGILDHVLLDKELSWRTDRDVAQRRLRAAVRLLNRMSTDDGGLFAALLQEVPNTFFPEAVETIASLVTEADVDVIIEQMMRRLVMTSETKLTALSHLLAQKPEYFNRNWDLVMSPLLDSIGAVAAVKWASENYQYASYRCQLIIDDAPITPQTMDVLLAAADFLEPSRRLQVTQDALSGARLIGDEVVLQTLLTQLRPSIQGEQVEKRDQRESLSRPWNVRYREGGAGDTPASKPAPPEEGETSTRAWATFLNAAADLLDVFPNELSVLAKQLHLFESRFGSAAGQLSTSMIDAFVAFCRLGRFNGESRIDLTDVISAIRNVQPEGVQCLLAAASLRFVPGSRGLVDIMITTLPEIETWDARAIMAAAVDSLDADDITSIIDTDPQFASTVPTLILDAVAWEQERRNSFYRTAARLPLIWINYLEVLPDEFVMGGLEGIRRLTEERKFDLFLRIADAKPQMRSMVLEEAWTIAIESRSQKIIMERFVKLASHTPERVLDNASRVWPSLRISVLCEVIPHLAHDEALQLSIVRDLMELASSAQEEKLAEIIVKIGPQLKRHRMEIAPLFAEVYARLLRQLRSMQRPTLARRLETIATCAVDIFGDEYAMKTRGAIDSVRAWWP